jgi:hypothetical protein
MGLHTVLSKYAVAAVEITSSLTPIIDLEISIDEGFLGKIRRDSHLDFSKKTLRAQAPRVLILLAVAAALRPTSYLITSGR